MAGSFSARLIVKIKYMNALDSSSECCCVTEAKGLGKGRWG